METDYKHDEQCGVKKGKDCTCEVAFVLLDEARAELNNIDAKKVQRFS